MRFIFREGSNIPDHHKLVGSKVVGLVIHGHRPIEVAFSRNDLIQLLDSKFTESYLRTVANALKVEE